MPVLTATDYAKAYSEAFDSKRRVDATTGCHVWTAQVRKGGYGGFRMGRYQLAHHAAVVLDGRIIPEGMVVDHTCRNRLCVNPAHLRVVTPRVNTLENSDALAAINARKTHCIHGHALAGANLIVRTRGGRDCRTCLRSRQARSRKRLADGMTAALSRVEVAP